LGGCAVFPIYIGDDVTDEDAFKTLKKRGVGIVVAETRHATAAVYGLKNPGEVEAFLSKLADRIPRAGRP
jgi:trehalose-phosphatase